MPLLQFSDGCVAFNFRVLIQYCITEKQMHQLFLPKTRNSVQCSVQKDMFKLQYIKSTSLLNKLFLRLPFEAIILSIYRMVCPRRRLRQFPYPQESRKQVTKKAPALGWFLPCISDSTMFNKKYLIYLIIIGYNLHYCK